MIPYATTEDDEPLQIVPWTNYGLIAANFLVFFYEFAVSAEGDGPLTRLINGFSHGLTVSHRSYQAFF